MTRSWAPLVSIWEDLEHRLDTPVSTGNGTGTGLVGPHREMRIGASAAGNGA